MGVSTIFNYPPDGTRKPATLNISGDVLIDKHIDFGFLDLTAGDVTITLGDISTGEILKNIEMTFKITSNPNSHHATFKSLSGSNFEDEDIEVGNDPLLGVIIVVADDTNFWNTLGVI